MKIFPLTLFHKTLASVLAILLPILIIFLYGYQRNREYMKGNVLNTVSAIAEAYEGQVFQFLEMSRRRAVDFSSDGFIRDELVKLNSGDRGAASRLREHLVKNKIVLDKSINRICVINFDGRIVASTEPGVIGDSIAGEEFFEKARGAVTIAERLSKRMGVSELAVGAPLTDKTTGAPIGVIINFVEFTEFGKILSGMFSKELGALTSERGRPATMEIYLVNRDRLMMTESIFVKDAPMRQMVDTLPVQRCLSFRQEFAGFYKDYRGVEVAGASMCLPDLNWTLLVEVDTSEALAPISDLQKDAVIAAGSVAALLGIFFAVFFKTIVARLYVISRAAVRLSKGDYEVRVPVTSGDEIGALSDSFNNMTSEIQRREETIKESEGRLRAVVDNSGALIYLKDMDGRYLLVNKACWEGLKRNREEMIGRSDFDFMPRDVAQAFRENDLKALDGKGAMEFEETAVWNGAVRQYLSVKVPLLDADGNPYALCGISTDITEIKQRERELALLHELSVEVSASEDFLGAVNAALKSMCVATGWAFGEAWVPEDEYTLRYLCYWPADGPARLKFVDKSRGITFRRGVGLPGRVWAARKYEWCKDLSIDGVIFMRNGVAKEAGFKAGVGVPIMSGERVLAVIVFFMTEPREEDRHIIEFVFVAAAQLGSVLLRKIAEDERKELQLKYEGLVNNLTVGVYRSGEDGRFLDVNPACAAILGASGKDGLLSRSIDDFYCDGGKRRDQKEKLGKNGEFRNEDVEFMTLHGRKIWVSLSAVAKKDMTGGVYHDGIIADITEKKSLEEQLRQSQKIEAIGRLAGGIAHDFNNLLTAMIGYGNLLILKRGDDEIVKGFAEHILTLSEKAAHLTQGLLAFSRKQVMNLRPVETNAIVRGVEKLLARLIGEDIELREEISDKNLIVLADSVQIEQVLMNLATNARDAMPEGGVLAISTGLSELDDDYVRAHGYGAPGRYAFISFSDTGKGMDADTRQRIFEPFFTTKEVGKGTGLGLSIAYGIIKQHNGYINVYSEPGKGTTFRIYLPLIEATAEEVTAAPHAPVRGGTETLLLAEDEPDVLDITKRMLEEFGYTVIAAVDGEEAVARYRERQKEISLAILDMVMPKKSGPETCEELRRLSPGVKIIFTSGYAEEMIRARGLVRENLNFISKPASPGDFLRKIREVLDK